MSTKDRLVSSDQIEIIPFGFSKHFLYRQTRQIHWPAEPMLMSTKRDIEETLLSFEKQFVRIPEHSSYSAHRPTMPLDRFSLVEREPKKTHYASTTMENVSFRIVGEVLSLRQKQRHDYNNRPVDRWDRSNG